MIQRIQSIYLLLAAILMAVTIFCPLLEVLSDVNIGHLFTKGIFVNSLVKSTWGVLFFNVLSFVLCLFSIFMYKNRKKQIKTVWLSIISSLLLYVTIIVYLYSFDLLFHIQAYHIACIFPLLSIILEIMAILRIKKDDKLVKSLNRIR